MYSEFKEEIQMKAIAITAIAGLAAAATAGTSVDLNFAADRTSADLGETITWTVSASFTGTAASGYFGGFVGDYVASDNALGVSAFWISNMGGNATTPEGGVDASMRGFNYFNSALLGTDNQDNPIVIGTFQTVAGAVGDLSFSADGVVSLFNDDGIFTLPAEFSGLDVSSSDTVAIVPAPGALALLGLGGLIAGRRRG
jgi:hypothetical protein